MNKILLISFLWFGLSCSTVTSEISNEDKSMTAKGIFEADLKPQADEGFVAGRMTIDKTYSGGMSGIGKGQMISKRIEGGAAVYYAVEEFSGSVEGKRGAFTLIHKGFMNAEVQTLDVDILDGSGSGDLESITGSMTINRESERHSYELIYSL